MSDLYTITRGQSPLIVSIPHAGTFIPEDISSRMTDLGVAVPDTDWFLDQLYDFVADMDATIIVSNVSRYVVDLNRPPDGGELYPGGNTTGLCPEVTFDGQQVYKPVQAPDESEMAMRRALYWFPYHTALQAEIARVRAEHDQVFLYDAHSIRSEIPRLFDGVLPDLNFGTNEGQSCALDVQLRVVDALKKENDYTHVVNGRFKGGYITRKYGNPDAGIQAMQMEIAQKTYMNEQAPYTYDSQKADKLKKTLRHILDAFVA